MTKVQTEQIKMIRGSLAETGKKKQTLAEKIGITPVTLSNWQRNPERMSVDNLRRLAIVIGWEAEDIGRFVLGVKR